MLNYIYYGLYIEMYQTEILLKHTKIQISYFENLKMGKLQQ